MNREKIAQLLYSIIMTDKAIDLLGDSYTLLGETLEESRLQYLIDKGIFINVVLSPASISHLNKPVPASGKIISIDNNSIKIFNSREKVAIVLHEIGHALLGPSDFEADGYVEELDFGNEIITSLERGIRELPHLFNTSMNRNRVNAMKKKLGK